MQFKRDATGKVDREVLATTRVMRPIPAVGDVRVSGAGNELRSTADSPRHAGTNARTHSHSHSLARFFGSNEDLVWSAQAKTVVDDLEHQIARGLR